MNDFSIWRTIPSALACGIILTWVCSCSMFGHHADMTDHYPAGYEQKCAAASAWGREQVKGVLKKEPQCIWGWTVTVVEGEDSPYGKAIKCDASPTGWAGAVTVACKTQIVRSRISDGNLRHEARHYWAYMNGVDVGL